MIWITNFCFILILTVSRVGLAKANSECLDQNGFGQMCRPRFKNAAFNKVVEATDTCGLNGAETFCYLDNKPCDICDDSSHSHPADYMTDFGRQTWWQSSTMLEDIQFPNTVNLTLNLGKSYEITYITLTFHSSRPDSFAIYKRTTEQSPWVPYQYYSAFCEETYNLQPNEIIPPGNEQKAICVNEFSDIWPLSGASVDFSTLSRRPGAFDFDNSETLQDWVTASSIRIVLNRLNTLGDEIFGDPDVLRSYYYAISDFSVGGRCKCNGHGGECRTLEDQTEECVCSHHTTGPDCGECEPFYNDQPWQRADYENAHECKACDCNGLSNRCFFDEELYDRTGHGGHCLDCRDNTTGPNCEQCEDGYIRTSNNGGCVPSS